MVQLNMGKGKTRVIVPMLVLEWVGKDWLTRLNVLPSILHEAVEYYRNALVASTQSIKLYTLPFHRKVVLDEKRERVITEVLFQCKQTNGFLIVTPRHRNSLLLKQYDQNVVVNGLKYATLDIIDESDAILHHDFQLVYALGDQMSLPDGHSRWNAIEALLMALVTVPSEALPDPGCFHKEHVKSGSFPNFRLLLPFFRNDKAMHSLGQVLCSHIVRFPPYQFRWMDLLAEDRKELLIRIICLSDCDAEKMIGQDKEFKKNRHDILSLRGCIAYRLLFHGLASRHRVNYGVDMNSKKKIAVPFSASDTPKDSSEFSHPDMAILYTVLSYLHSGLSLSQFQDSLNLLEGQGPTAKRQVFQGWTDSVKNDVDCADLKKFDNIAKIDPSNRIQVSLMHKYLGNAMLVIIYWMNHFVFPHETHQFSKKRATSAWNLVDKNSIGFSGTDDTKLMLPLAVKQRPAKTRSLRGTNGLMIDLILQCTDSKIQLLEDVNSSSVLNLCAKLTVDALIDVGGAMAGTTNRQVASEMALKTNRDAHRGIVYFESETNQWHVLEIESNRYVALRSSSLKESECFVYFDESRCRGADKKLKRDACALVTLEPKLTKDRFLQGCARMRKLGKNQQRLILAGPREVVSPSSSVKSVLEMIVHNTASLTRKALPIYLDHGIDYSKFPKPLEVPLALEDLYQSPVEKNRDFLEYLDAHTEVQVDSSDHYKHLVSHCREVGKGLLVESDGFGQECERELEEVLEEEKQQENETIVKRPSAQTPWDFSLPMNGNFESLFGAIFHLLQDFVRTKLPNLVEIEWSCNLYCTLNFWKTIEESFSCNDMSLYMRLVNPMLVFKDGRVVLVTLFELDELLPHWWMARNNKRGTPSSIEHLSRVINPSQKTFGLTLHSVSVEVLTSIKLFCGMVDYTTEEKQVLSSMFRNVPRVRLTVERLLEKRHRLLHLERSDLEAVCDTAGSW